MDTTKEAKLHEGSALSLRPCESLLLHFLSTRPKRGGGYGCSPTTHAGNLFAPPYSGETARMIPYPAANCKRNLKRAQTIWQCRKVGDYGNTGSPSKIEGMAVDQGSMIS